MGILEGFLDIPLQDDPLSFYGTSLVMFFLALFSVNTIVYIKLLFNSILLTLKF